MFILIFKIWRGSKARSNVQDSEKPFFFDRKTIRKKNGF